VIDTIPAIVLTVERAAIAVVPNVNNVPVNALVATLPAVVICNNLESAIEPASIVFVTVPVSPEVINIPEVAGIVSVVAPATADGTNVTVPEVDPGKTIDKIPVKAWLADALFKTTAVVPNKTMLLPKTAAEIY
jgi:hypothetical protein